MVFSPYYPPHVGGLESHAQEFNENVSSYFDEVVVLTTDLPETGKFVEEESATVKVYRFPATEIVSNFPIFKFWKKDFWKLLKIINETRYSIVISRTRFFLTSLMALIFSKKNHYTWIHIEHGSDYVKLSNPLTTLIARIYDESIGRLIFKNSDYNVPISKAVDKFIEKFDKRPRMVITRGLNIKNIEAIEVNKAISKKYKNFTKFIFCGRLYKWKGIERSISLINQLLKENEKVVFLIIGGGEDYEKLKKYKSKNIVFLGKKSRDEAISIMKCGDIYLHSSYSGGGLSTSLLEAMLCGCCPVATKNEGASEVISDAVNGFICNFDKTLELKDKVKTLLENDLYKIYGNKARLTIIDKFSWNKSIKNYIKLFEAI